MKERLNLIFSSLIAIAMGLFIITSIAILCWASYCFMFVSEPTSFHMRILFTIFGVFLGSIVIGAVSAIFIDWEDKEVSNDR